MKIKSYWFLLGLIGIAIVIVSFLSAVVTTTGAFGADPGKPVNRIDFVLIAAGLVIQAFSFYKARKLKSQ